MQWSFEWPSTLIDLKTNVGHPFERYVDEDTSFFLGCIAIVAYQKVDKWTCHSNRQKPKKKKKKQLTRHTQKVLLTTNQRIDFQSNAQCKCKKSRSSQVHNSTSSNAKRSFMLTFIWKVQLDNDLSFYFPSARLTSIYFLWCVSNKSNTKQQQNVLSLNLRNDNIMWFQFSHIELQNIVGVDFYSN